MSAFASSGGDSPHHTENSHKPNYNTVDVDVFLQDPLLQPGSYIETPPYLISGQPFQRRELIINERNIHGPLMDGVLNSVDGLTESVAVESMPSSRRRARAGKGLAGAPSWLPDGWQVITKVRANGATAGLTDKYYVDPLSGSRFRSKKEVEYYLQTGTKRKKASVTDAEGNPADNQGPRKLKKSPFTKESSMPLNFDFLNVPQGATWVLTDAARDQWVPALENKMVPKSTRLEWEAAFGYSLK